MKKVITLLCLIVVIGVIFSVSLAFASVTITGVVTDGTNPVKGIRVGTADRTLEVYTDSNGAYSFGASPGEYTLIAAGFGYDIASQDTGTIADGDTKTVNFTLTKSATDVYEDGNGPFDPNKWIVDTGSDPTFDSDGNMVLAPMTFIGSRAVASSGSVEFRMWLDSTDETNDIWCGLASSIQGFGNNYAYYFYGGNVAHITWTPTNGYHGLDGLASDSTGHPWSPYTPHAYKIVWDRDSQKNYIDGVPVLSTNVTVEPNTMLVFINGAGANMIIDYVKYDFPATKMNITGVVTDGTNPVKGVRVATADRALEAYTDDNGAYTLKNADPGAYTLIASGFGYDIATQDTGTVAAGDTRTVNFTLTKSATDFYEDGNGPFDTNKWILATGDTPTFDGSGNMVLAPMTSIGSRAVGSSGTIEFRMWLDSTNETNDIWWGLSSNIQTFGNAYAFYFTAGHVSHITWTPTNGYHGLDGFAPDSSGNPWDPYSPHVYKIVWTGTAQQNYIDDIMVLDTKATIDPNTMLAFNNGTGANMIIDYVKYNPSVSMTQITGVVTDGTNPLKGIRVGTADRTLETYTDSNGAYSIGVSPGDYTFIVAEFGYNIVTQDTGTIAAGDTRTVNFTLTKPATDFYEDGNGPFDPNKWIVATGDTPTFVDGNMVLAPMTSIGSRAVGSSGTIEFRMWLDSTDETNDIWWGLSNNIQGFSNSYEFYFTGGHISNITWTPGTPYHGALNGFAPDSNGNPWDPYTPHVYKIVWTGTAQQNYIDDIMVLDTKAIIDPNTMLVFNNGAGANMIIDYVKYNPSVSMTQITGVATDGTNPLKGVRVATANGALQTYTDSNGAYSISVSPGEYTLIAAGFGHNIVSQDTDTIAFGDTRTVNFTLPKSTTDFYEDGNGPFDPNKWIVAAGDTPTFADGNMVVDPMTSIGSRAVASSGTLEFRMWLDAPESTDIWWGLSDNIQGFNNSYEFYLSGGTLSHITWTPQSPYSGLDGLNPDSEGNAWDATIPHVYKIVWNGGSQWNYIDGVLVLSTTVTVGPNTMLVFNNADANMYIDYVKYSSSTQIQITTGVTGVVTDGTNPLKGIRVGTADRTLETYTDDNGAYSFETASGEYTLIAAGFGYNIATQDTGTIADGAVNTVNFTLTKSATDVYEDGNGPFDPTKWILDKGNNPSFDGSGNMVLAPMTTIASRAVASSGSVEFRMWLDSTAETNDIWWGLASSTQGFNNNYSFYFTAGHVSHITWTPTNPYPGHGLDALASDPDGKAWNPYTPHVYKIVWNGGSQWNYIDGIMVLSTQVTIDPNTMLVFINGAGANMIIDYVKYSPPVSTTITNAPNNFVQKGWNLISLPAAPIDGTPSVIMNGIDMGNASLQLWDNASQSGGGYLIYGVNWIGPMKVGDAYWFIESAGKSISYTSISVDSSDKTIQIPAHDKAPYWIMVGMPFNQKIACENIKFTAGSDTKVWADAVSAGWIEAIAQGWEANGQQYFNAGLATNPAAAKTYFEPWYGYWMLVKTTSALTITVPTTPVVQ